MTDRLTLPLWEPVQAHAALMTAWQRIKPLLLAGHRLTLEVRKETRSSEQNRLLWARLGEVAEQVDWHGNRLTAEEWKDVFTAGLKRQRAVPGIDGGFVVLGTSTSKMTKDEMTQLLELIAAFGAEHAVNFSEI